MATRRQALSPLYLESSAFLLGILNDDAEILRLLGQDRAFFMSELTVLETERTLVRAEVLGTSSRARIALAREHLEAFRNASTILPVTKAVAARAGQPFPVEPVRSLDAIHLASALAARRRRARVAVLTTDHRVRENAAALRMEVLPLPTR